MKRIKSDESKNNLKEINEKYDDLNEQIEKNNMLLFKLKFIRNLKIFGCLLNFVAPFCVTGAIVTTGFYITGFGLPFVKDKEKNYKKYSFESSDGNVILEESYSGGVARQINYGSTNFEVYSPWIKNSTGYERTIQYYDEKELTDLNLYKALKEKNVNYIYLNYDYIDEEIEWTNNLDSNEINEDYTISGILTCIDKNDFILTTESNSQNNITTFGVLGLTTLASFVCMKFRGYKLKDKIENHISEYKKSKEELQHIQNKVKVLDRSVNEHGR